MQCDRARELISAYLDDEIAEPQAREFGGHLRDCPVCAALLADYRRMGRQLRMSGREPVPAGLETSVRAALAAAEPTGLVTAADGVELPPLRRPVPFHARQVAAIAAALAVTCLLSVLATWFAMTERGGIAAVERDVFSAHARAMLQDSPIQIASSDQHTVRPWFNGRLEYAPEAKDLAVDGFPLAGGRLDYVDGRRVGVLVYKRRLHVINVFTWPAPGAPDRQPQVSARNGYNMLRWARGGATFWAVSDLNADELRQLQGLL